MNKFLFLLLLLPVSGFAQKDKEETNKPSDGKLVLVHADKTVTVAPEKKDDKKNLKDDTKYFGAVKFKIGGNTITCDSAKVLENDGIVEAYNVTLSSPDYFTTKGALLTFNKATLGGTVTKDITVTALNGNVIGTSESVVVDLKNESYRIGMGNITPPEPAK